MWGSGYSGRTEDNKHRLYKQGEQGQGGQGGAGLTGRHMGRHPRPWPGKWGLKVEGGAVGVGGGLMGK